MRNKEEGLQEVLCLLIIILSFPLHVIWMSWIFLCLWDWFIVATFDITSLTLVQAAGIQTLLTLERIKREQKSKKDEEETAFDVLGKIIGLWFVLPGIVLLLGIIIKQFM